MTTPVPLDESFYSHHFIVLKHMGVWVAHPRNPKFLNAYSAYKLTVTLFQSLAAILVFADFWEVFGDLRKMSWNLCVNMLITGGFVKSLYNTHRSNVINSMRVKLHVRATTRDTPDDQVINKLSEREMKRIRIFFYGGVGLVGPLWLISWYFSYLWGPRGIPLPVYVPFDWDPDDEFQYNVVFLVLAVSGSAGVLFVVELEMAMFTLLIQISREYNRLLKDFRSINKSCVGGFWSRGRIYKEVNPLLRKLRVKNLLKRRCREHQQLIQYTKDFELSYGFALLLQMVFLSLVITLLAVLCILEFGNLSLNISYQLGSISLLSVDMFLVCWYSSRIHGQCRKIGEEAYSILWYQLATDVQKDISMVVMRSQHPPKITSGKLMEINLNAFMIMFRNVYSCLAVFRQLTKTN